MSTSDTGMTDAFTGRLPRLYGRAFGVLERIGDRWLLGLAARFTFVAVLLPYYYHSALTKTGAGLLGFLQPTAGAFAQIVPPIAEHYMYDTSAIPFLPWHLVVILGTLAELALPVLIALGALTRPAALGMIFFVTVQMVVDIAFHGAAPGTLFTGEPGVLLAQRLLWVLLLLTLVIKGPGSVSVDALLGRRPR